MMVERDKKGDIDTETLAHWGIALAVLFVLLLAAFFVKSKFGGIGEFIKHISTLGRSR